MDSLARERRTERPRLLDLFCGAGGCAVGYDRAGFEVLGVDIAPQPRYPFRFVQADALEYLSEHGHEFDVIHASPPCQAYSVASKFSGTSSNHPDLVAPTRIALERTRKPWVIENVVGSPLGFSIILCGSMFDLPIRRHRVFESSTLLLAPGRCVHGKEKGNYPAGRSRNAGRPNRSRVVIVCGEGGSRGSVALWSDAMGINWMRQKELSQAIPPAYTEYLGRQLVRVATLNPLA